MDDVQLVARVAPAPHVAGGLRVERARDPADELPGPVEPDALGHAGVGLARERRHDLRLALRADPGNVAQTAGGGRPTPLRRWAVERASDVEHAPGAQTQVTAEADEVGHELALELCEPRDRSRRH